LIRFCTLTQKKETVPNTLQCNLLFLFFGVVLLLLRRCGVFVVVVCICIQMVSSAGSCILIGPNCSAKICLSLVHDSSAIVAKHRFQCANLRTNAIPRRHYYLTFAENFCTSADSQDTDKQIGRAQGTVYLVHVQERSSSRSPYLHLCCILFFR
jgi:hypothetical protein